MLRNQQGDLRVYIEDVARSCARRCFRGSARDHGAVRGAASEPSLTKPINATKDDLNPGRTYGTPFFAQDPSNSRTIVAGFIEFRTRSCGLMRSTDSGTTWKILVDSPPALKSYPYCLANNSNIFHAPLAFGRNGDLYLATQAWDTPDSRNKVSVQVAKSSNLGDSWTTVLAHDSRPTADAEQTNDRPVTGIVVDRDRGSQDIVYVTVCQGFPNTSAPNSRIQRPVMLISRDAGATFEAPVVIPGDYWEKNPANIERAISSRTTLANTTTTLAAAGSLGEKLANPANYGSAGNGQGLVMDNRGTLYYGWLTASANITPSVPSSLLVSKSTDQGRTWTSTEVQPAAYNNRQNARLAWTPGGGSQGTVHLVWEYSPRPEIASYAEATYVRSTDGGATWSEPKRLPDSDPAALQGSYLPNVQVAPNGRLDAVWWDTRNDPGVRANDVYYAYSTDHGETWSKNYRITDQSIDRRFGVYGNNFDQNGPPGMLSTNEYALFGWDDTRNSRDDTATGVQASDPVRGEGLGIGGGVQDIFVAAAQFEAIGGGASKAAKIVFAGVIGLLAVGLALTVVALLSRKRVGGAPAPPKPAKQAPAEAKS